WQMDRNRDVLTVNPSSGIESQTRWNSTMVTWEPLIRRAMASRTASAPEYLQARQYPSFAAVRIKLMAVGSLSGPVSAIKTEATGLGVRRSASAHLPSGTDVFALAYE